MTTNDDALARLHEQFPTVAKLLARYRSVPQRQRAARDILGLALLDRYSDLLIEVADELRESVSMDPVIDVIGAYLGLLQSRWALLGTQSQTQAVREERKQIAVALRTTSFAVGEDEETEGSSDGTLSPKRPEKRTRSKQEKARVVHVCADHLDAAGKKEKETGTPAKKNRITAYMNNVENALQLTYSEYFLLRELEASGTIIASEAKASALRRLGRNPQLGLTHKGDVWTCARFTIRTYRLGAQEAEDERRRAIEQERAKPERDL